jgi:DNA primase
LLTRCQALRRRFEEHCSWEEATPSLNAQKNLFYCHGCGQNGDLIRFVELSRRLSFPQSLTYLQQQSIPTDAAGALEQAAAFYQQQFPHRPEALRYLEQRGVHDPALIEEPRSDYAETQPMRVLFAHAALNRSRSPLFRACLSLSPA